jgi:hypothetical protein
MHGDGHKDIDMKFKLIPTEKNHAIIVNGRPYALLNSQFREYPQEIIDRYGDKLIPEHEPKKTKKTKNDDNGGSE